MERSSLKRISWIVPIKTSKKNLKILIPILENIFTIKPKRAPRYEGLFALGGGSTFICAITSNPV